MDFIKFDILPIRIDTAINRLIKISTPKFKLFRDELTALDYLRLEEKEQRFQRQILERFCDEVYENWEIIFSLWLAYPSIKNPAHVEACGKKAFAPTKKDFFNLVLDNATSSYNQKIFGQDKKGEVFIERHELSSLEMIFKNWSEYELEEQLKHLLKTPKLACKVIYRCWLDVNKKMEDFNNIRTLNQWSVVKTIDPYQVYKSKGLILDKKKNINEPFDVIIGYIDNYDPSPGAPTKENP
jgi:hypothetical protein